MWQDIDAFMHVESVRVQNMATNTAQSCEDTVEIAYTHVVQQHRLRSCFSTHHVLDLFNSPSPKEPTPFTWSHSTDMRS